MKMALRLYEDSLCSGCNQPGTLAFDQFNAGEFEACDDLTCLGCEALERMREEARPSPGMKIYLRNHIDDDLGGGQ